VPAIEQRYTIDPARRTLWGFSLSGLLATTILLERRGAFASYLITSPSLWWDRSWIFAREEALASSDATATVHVYIAVGEQEEAEVPWAKMVTHVNEFGNRLVNRGYRGSTVTVEVLPGESHLSSAAASLARGLRILVVP
jgi:predicted alpha/beta superfamily hydrolase